VIESREAANIINEDAPLRTATTKEEEGTRTEKTSERDKKKAATPSLRFLSILENNKGVRCKLIPGVSNRFVTPFSLILLYYNLCHYQWPPPIIRPPLPPPPPLRRSSPRG